LRVAIVLAAGRSRRFGRADKLAARIGKRSLLDHVIDRARASGACRILIIGAGRAMRPLPRVRWLRSPASREGMGGSLRVALHALRPIERELLVFLGDMPFAAVPRRFVLRAGLDAVRPSVGGRPGHPLLVRSRVARALAPAGDGGLVVKLVKGRVGLVPGGRGHVIDIDTRRALRAARMDRAMLRNVRHSTSTRSRMWSLQAGSRRSRQ
jgi:molybdenum cofactor cytidylyltransferase